MTYLRRRANLECSQCLDPKYVAISSIAHELTVESDRRNVCGRKSERCEPLGIGLVDLIRGDVGHWGGSVLCEGTQVLGHVTCIPPRQPSAERQGGNIAPVCYLDRWEVLKV